MFFLCGLDSFGQQLAVAIFQLNFCQCLSLLLGCSGCAAPKFIPWCLTLRNHFPFSSWRRHQWHHWPFENINILQVTSLGWWLYLCAHTHRRIYIYIHIYIYTRVYLYLYHSISMYIYIYTNTIHNRACVYVWMYIYIYIHMYM